MEINHITILKQALLASQSDLLLLRKTEGFFKWSCGEVCDYIVHNNNKLGMHSASGVKRSDTIKR